MQGYGCSPHQAESTYTFELTSSYPGLVYGIGSQKCFLQPALSPKEPVLVCLLMAPHCKGIQWTTDLDQAPPRIQNPPHSSLTKKHQGSVRQLKASGVRARVYSWFPWDPQVDYIPVWFSDPPWSTFAPFLLVFSRYHGEKTTGGGHFLSPEIQGSLLFSGFSEVN